MLTVRTLGAEALLFNQQPVTISWQKAREILFYLLHQPNGVRIEALREAIWPELDDRRRERLRTAIYQLRMALPRELIELHGRQIYRLNLDIVRVDYDVERFLQTTLPAPSGSGAQLDRLVLPPHLGAVGAGLSGGDSARDRRPRGTPKRGPVADRAAQSGDLQSPPRAPVRQTA